MEQKCKLNQKAVADCISSRLQILFLWLKISKREIYDFRDVKLKFTPNMPQDDLTTAQMLSAVGTDFFTKETAYSLFSFISNPQNEIEKKQKEDEENPVTQGIGLLNNSNSSSTKVV